MRGLSEGSLGGVKRWVVKGRISDMNLPYFWAAEARWWERTPSYRNSLRGERDRK